jgi:Raf kinase inhibitor-like YbhB/YbcL family protein
VFALFAWTTVCAAAPAVAGDFIVTSPGLKAQGKIAEEHVYKGFGCDGGNVSPELRWESAPANTKSFAVTMYDPDAPTGSGWWHWLVFDIPPTVTKLVAGAGNTDKGAAPTGSVQSRTDFGTPGYGGPCPPKGDKPHRYIFTVYALKVESLPLKGDASGAMVGFFLNQNALAKATLTAEYGR